MHVTLVPAGTQDAASSRIRAYTLQRSLVRLGVHANYRYSAKTDVLVIQKKITPRIVKVAARAKQCGTTIIYDIDDVGDALGNWVPAPLLEELLAMADVVTTDTIGHKEWLQNMHPNVQVTIIPDAIDYYPDAPVHIPQRDVKPLRVLWFGNIANIGLFEQYSNFLSSLPDVQVVVITGTYGTYGLHGETTRRYVEKYPKVQFLPWSRNSFIQNLQRCQLACLMHDGTNIERTKSNNKLITSITWGVPGVVSNTPEYRRTAEQAGVDFAVFSDTAELQQAIDVLRSAKARAEYLAAAQPVIWKYYSPETVAIEFLKLVCTLPSERIDKRAIESLLDMKPSITGSDRDMNLVRATRLWVKKHMPYRVKVLLAPYVPAISRSLLNDPERVRDYKMVRISSLGRNYRTEVYERQRQGGMKPLTSNPTIEEVRSVLRAHSPSSVLEVGCGWGRLISAISDEFRVEGCDVSADMLRLCPPELKVFEYDIAAEPDQFIRDHTYHWDVIFTRGVMLYMVGSPLKTMNAMNNMLMLARKKIVFWEWPEVCEWLQQFSDSSKFEYHPIEHKEE